MISDLTVNVEGYPNLKLAGGGRPLDAYVRTATAALLLSIVYADQKCEAKEIRSSLKTLERHFAMRSPGESLKILEEAEGLRNKKDLGVFLEAARRDLDTQTKQELVSMVWETAMSDGQIQDEEQIEVGQLVSALGLTDEQAEAARRAAAARV